MNYKENKWYKVAYIIFIISVVLVAVTTLLMALGRDFAIIWFFASLVPLAISSMVMANIKYKSQIYVEGDYTAVDRVRDFFSDTKNFFVKKGLTGSILFILLFAATVCSVLQVVKTATTVYEYLGAKNAGYAFNLRESERYSKLAEEALINGDEKYAERCRILSEKHLEDSQSYYKTTQKLKPVRDKQLQIMWFVLGVNAGVLIVYVVVFSARKRKQGEKKP